VQDYIIQRVMEIGDYILETGYTVRQTAQVFGVSKSTVHKDVTERLPLVNANLAMEVRKILEKNKAERHLRGGEATRLKYYTLRYEEQEDFAEKDELSKAT
jgi:putative DeoR family transcriptional regulator (stage III sporulation protein D)